MHAVSEAPEEASPSVVEQYWSKLASLASEFDPSCAKMRRASFEIGLIAEQLVTESETLGIGPIDRALLQMAAIDNQRYQDPRKALQLIEAYLQEPGLPIGMRWQLSRRSYSLAESFREVS